MTLNKESRGRTEDARADAFTRRYIIAYFAGTMDVGMLDENSPLEVDSEHQLRETLEA